MLTTVSNIILQPSSSLSSNLHFSSQIPSPTPSMSPTPIYPTSASYTPPPHATPIISSPPIPYTYTPSNTSLSTTPPISGLPHWLLYVYVAAGVAAFILVLCFCFFLIACLIRAGRRRRHKLQLMPLYQMEQEYSDEEDEMLMREHADYNRNILIESAKIQPILSFES